jgi:molybdopterin/thiamine biosynthesis adenylyltransferase
MSEEAILLKLKREFQESEAVKLALKMVADLEFELGIVKSERDEAIDRAKEGQPKKLWLKDELIIEMTNQLNRQQKRNTEDRKALNEWRNKYFSLLAKQPSHP